jgi:hypothetical protein
MRSAGVVEQAEVVDAVARGGGEGDARYRKQADQKPAERPFHERSSGSGSLIIAHAARRERERGERREPIIRIPGGLYLWRTRYTRIRLSGNPRARSERAYATQY